VYCEYFYYITNLHEGLEVEISQGNLIFEVFKQEVFPKLEDFGAAWLSSVAKLLVGMKEVSADSQFEPEQQTNLRLV
jgi:hypothetical protein